MTLDSLLAVEMVIGIVDCWVYHIIPLQTNKATVLMGMCLLSITSEGTLFSDKLNTQIEHL